MDFTNFDAIEFSHDGKTHIRLYYQTKDRTLRESSFETGNGWFVRTNGIIATNAKENSPITGTRWEKDGQIRVYFLDEGDAICECVGVHTTTGTVWESTSPSTIQVRNAPNQKAKAAPGSALAIARPGVDDETLRLFYQVEMNSKFPIREIRYQDDEGIWSLQRRQIEGAARHSSFSAVSAGRAGAVRVYYMDNNNALRVGVWNSPFSRWEEFEVGDTDYILAPKAPISAVCWYEKPPDDFRLRIYTILNSNPLEVVELARNGDDWKRNLQVVDLDMSSNKSALAVSRNKRADLHNPISVFYQPHHHVIEVAVADRERKINPVAAVSLKPRGLPTARGPLSQNEGSVPPGYKYVPDGFEVVAAARVIPPGQKVVPANAVILAPDQKAVSQSAVVLHPGQKAVSQSAVVLQPGQKVVPANAVILAPDQKAVSQSAVILQPGQIAVPANAVILAPDQKAVSQSAVVLQPDQRAVPLDELKRWYNIAVSAMKWTPYDSQGYNDSKNLKETLGNYGPWTWF